MLGLGFDCSQLQQRQCGCIRVAAKFTTRPSTIISVTRGLPSVSVPVLSKATTFTVAARSRWTPPLNKTRAGPRHRSRTGWKPAY